VCGLFVHVASTSSSLFGASPAFSFLPASSTAPAASATTAAPPPGFGVAPAGHNTSASGFTIGTATQPTFGTTQPLATSTQSNAGSTAPPPPPANAGFTQSSGFQFGGSVQSAAGAGFGLLPTSTTSVGHLGSVGATGAQVPSSSLFAAPKPGLCAIS